MPHFLLALFTHCGARVANDKTDIHMNNVCLMSVGREAIQRGEGEMARVFNFSSGIGIATGGST